LAFDNVLKKNVAIKKMCNTFSQGKEYQKRILREILIMLHFVGHPNIINLTDLILPRTFNDFQDIYIVMDAMQQDMGKLIRSNLTLGDQDIKYFLYQILCGIYALHSANVLHRDLKPSNILLNEKMDVRICDFGLARGLDLQNFEDPFMSTFYVVTRWYRAPELCMSYQNSYKELDMWSVGCIFAELLQKPPRKQLFPGNDTIKQLKLILDVLGQQNPEDIKGVKDAVNFVLKYAKNDKQKWQSFPQFFHVKDKDALDLLDKMLQFNPEKRITVEEALKHPYLELDKDDLIQFPKVDFKFNDDAFEEDKDYVKKN